MARIAGTASFLINGRSYSTHVEDGIDIKIQGVKRSAVASSDGEIHHSEMVVPDTISGRLITTETLNPEAIVAMSNVTLQVAMNNGMSAVLDEAFFSGDANVSTRDGAMAVEFTGRGRWLT